MNNKLKIIYKDIAINAKNNNTSFSCDNKKSFININQLRESYLVFNKYATLEKNYLILDGSFSPSPSSTNINNSNFGLWSDSLSKENHVFDDAIVLNITLDRLISSNGITLKFNPDTDDYCKTLRIDWYKIEVINNISTETLIDYKIYTLNNSIYFCSNDVDDYNKVKITFYSMNRPFRYLKLQEIDFGHVNIFKDEDLKNVSLTEEISLLSDELRINTLEFSINVKDDIEFMFKKRQPIKVIFKDSIIGNFFLDKAIRYSKNTYNINSSDYISLMDKNNFYGDMYVNKSVKTLIEEIMTSSNIDSSYYEIEDTFNNLTLTGYLPFMNCREALMNVLFVIGGVVNSCREEKIKIFMLNDDVVSTIDESKIYNKNNDFTDNDEVTGISITEHYYKSYITDDVVELYSGNNNDVTVLFNEPCHDLEITNGTIISSSANYAILSRTSQLDEMKLTGKKYTLTTNIINMSMQIVEDTLVKNVEVNNCTLINNTNSNLLINRLYDFYVTNNNNYHKFKAKFNNEKLGDLINFDTEFLVRKQGRIKSIRYNLNGSELVGDFEVKNIDV